MPFLLISFERLNHLKQSQQCQKQGRKRKTGQEKQTCCIIMKSGTRQINEIKETDIFSPVEQFSLNFLLSVHNIIHPLLKNSFLMLQKNMGQRDKNVNFRFPWTLQLWKSLNFGSHFLLNFYLRHWATLSSFSRKCLDFYSR